MEPRKPSFMEEALIKDLRKCTETRADLLEALVTVSEDWRSELHWETRELIHEAIEKARGAKGA
jgi:hypothetical protein